MSLGPRSMSSAATTHTLSTGRSTTSSACTVMVRSEVDPDCIVSETDDDPVINLKYRGRFFYSAESSPYDCSELYTSPPGRPVPLHFTPWQTCSFTLHPLADLFLYTSPSGRPVHSNTNSTSLGSIQPCCNYGAKTTRISTTVYRQVLIYTAEWTGATWGELEHSGVNWSIAGWTGAKWGELEQSGVNIIALKRQQEDSNPDSLDWESDVLTTTPTTTTIIYNK